MNNQDLYNILGIPPDSPVENIRKRFKKLSKQLHPDKLQHLSDVERKKFTKKYDEIILAYQILSNDELRTEYDQLRGVKQESTFEQLKKNSQKDLEYDLSSYADEHKKEIAQRHTHLLSGYKDRNIAEFKSTPYIPKGSVKDLKNPLKRRDISSEIIPMPEPVTYNTNKIMEFQTLPKIGEMYYCGDPDRTIQDYLSDVTLEDAEDAIKIEKTNVPIEERVRQQRMLRY